MSPAGATNGPTSERVVGEVRAVDAAFRFQVGGDPAETVDYRHGLEARLPFARDRGHRDVRPAVPDDRLGRRADQGGGHEHAVSLGASFGALVWIFQDGHLAGLLGFDSVGALDLWMPVLIFIFAFGLSMDYEVFLLSRIKEVHDETGDNDLAVAVGLQRAGASSPPPRSSSSSCSPASPPARSLAIKQLGVGLAIAVIIDATIVRYAARARHHEAAGRRGTGGRRSRCAPPRPLRPPRNPAAARARMKVPWRSPGMPSASELRLVRSHAWSHLDPDRMPAHVAIVMDGNGRWAQRRGLKRTEGHAAGEEALFDTVEGALEIGLRG